MPKSARCKFVVHAVDRPYDGAPEHERRVRMDAQYDENVSKEDAAFSQYTPWGSMEFGLANPALAGFFQPGKAYYIDITPAE